MPGRRGGQRLTMRKSSRTAAALASKHHEDELDEDESTVPDEAKWRTMTPYGLFAISGGDGAKYRFKRGDVATILPQHKAPGEHIEPHEYWVGKILEIRADAGSEDSHIIWAKVRWFYNAEDAAGIVKSLDTSRIGKFERLFSPHWDFVLPHTFNEVIPMPLLHPYPFLKRKKSGPKSLKLGGEGHVDTESISNATTSTTVEDGGFEPRLEDQVPIGPDMFYWRYTIDIVGKKVNPKPGPKSCLCSLSYSPDTTSLLKGVMFFCSRPTCRTSFHVGCLRDAKSIWVPCDQEVIVPTPQRSTSKLIRGRNAGRGRRTGAIRGKNGGKGKEKAEEEQVIADVQWLTPRALQRITRTSDSSDSLDLLSFLCSSPTISASMFHKKHRRQSNLSSTSPSPMISLLQRVYARQLQHHQHLQHQLNSSHKQALSAAFNKSKHSSAHSVPSVISTMSGGSWIEVEDLLVTEGEYGDADVDMCVQHNIPAVNRIRDDINNDDGVSGSRNGGSGGTGYTRDTISEPATPKSVSRPKPKSKLKSKSRVKEKEKSKQVQVEFPPTTTAPHKPLQVEPLTSATLLATLFLLPSPFPPSYASATSSQSTTAAATALPSLLTNISTTRNNTNAPTASTSTVSPAEKSASSSTDTSDVAIDSRDLLLLASQPLLRGAGYIPYLGPTGNVNLVLAARRLVWEVLSAAGGLELSSSLTTTNTTVTAPSLKKRGRHPKTKSSGARSKSTFTSLLSSTKTMEDDNMHGDERELDEAQQDIRDAEDFHKVLECVHSVIGGWKKRMKEEEKVLPPSAEVDDGIVIKEGLIYDDELLRLGGGGKANIIVGGERNGDGDGDVEMHNGATWEGDVEVDVEAGSLRSGKKRKRMDDAFKDGPRKKGKGKRKEKERQEGEKGEEGSLTPEEEEMLLRVDWACPSCGSLL